jgi:phosphoribosylformylglycinamidine synthase PurS subunit
VRIGKFMVVTLNSATREQATAQVEGMCKRLLANPVIEEYTFEVDGEDMPPAPRTRRYVSREG